MQQFKVIYVCTRKTQMLPNMCMNELHLVYIVVQNYAFVHQTCSVVIAALAWNPVCPFNLTLMAKTYFLDKTSLG